jgi:hypothetical protein
MDVVRIRNQTTFTPFKNGFFRGRYDVVVFVEDTRVSKMFFVPVTKGFSINIRRAMEKKYTRSFSVLGKQLT